MSSKIEDQISQPILLMQEEILKNLDIPGQLESLYQDDKTNFKRAFNLIYPEVQDKLTARIWNERLNYQQQGISFDSNKELIFVMIACFIAGLIAKIPDYTHFTQDFFYSRNLAFIVFPVLTAYFVYRQNFSIKKLLIISTVFIVSMIYINLLPDNNESDTLILACIHLPLFLWSVTGISFIGGKLHDYQKRLDFLRYNGDLVVMSTILVISAALLTGITFGLFELIDINIEYIFQHYIAVWGLTSLPIVGTYLVLNNPQLVSRVSPIIAKIFTPLVLVTLMVYLSAVIVTGKDPYNDREFLLVFNVLLIGVMALIFFSVAESSKSSESILGRMLLSGLSIVTIILNAIALSAIIFRISEWGITPNRLAVLGSNILILINLLLVTYRLFKSFKDKNEIYMVEQSIASYLPVYILWSILVSFLFPLIFGFK